MDETMTQTSGQPSAERADKAMTKSSEASGVAIPRRPDPDSPAELARSMLLESYAPAAVVIDAEYDIRYYSGSTQRYLRQPGGPPANDLFLLLDPMLRPGTRVVVDQAFAEGRRVDSPPLRMRRGDEDATVVIAVEPMPVRNGQLHALVTFRDREPVAPSEFEDGDLAEGVSLVRHLEASEQCYRQLVENMQEGVWMLDEEGATIFVNPQMAAMLGHRREALAEEDLSRHVWREDRERALELWQPNGASDEPREVELRLRHGQGQAVWCLARSSRIEDGELRGRLITFSDVSGLKAAEAELQRLAQGLEERVRTRTHDLEKERLFSETVLDNQPAPAMVLDRNGCLLRFNKACEAATGRDFADLRGTRDWLASVAPEERDAVETLVRDLPDGATPWRHENHWVHVDGTKRLFSWTNRVVRNDAGEVEYIVGNAVDITEERRSAERARQHLDEMARLQRLQTVNTLAAMLAHELNQPLSVIAMSADSCQMLLEQDRPDRDGLARGLDQIADQAVRGGDIIRRLRRFVARGEVQPVPLDLVEVIRHTVDLIRPRVNTAEIRLVTDLADGLPRVAAVDVHIQQVVFNLVNNAIEAISQAGTRDGEICVRLRRHDGRARVEVIDNGPGLDAAMPEQPFQPLFTTKEEGLGVGLQLSRDLVRAQGGRLWAETPDRGAAFIFELPFMP